MSTSGDSQAENQPLLSEGLQQQPPVHGTPGGLQRERMAEHDQRRDQDDQDQDPIEDGCSKMCSIACIFRMIFYLFCSITGQLTIYFHNQNWKKECGLAILIIWSSFWLLTFLLLNLGSLTFAVYVIAGCPFRNCSYIFLHNVTKWQTAVNSNDIQSLALQPEQESAYDDWQKTVFTTASISGLLSYCFMIIVLISQYSFLKKTLCHKVLCKSSTGRIISPFQDSGEKATCLNAWQAFYFHAIFWFNLALYASIIVVFYSILTRVIGSYDHILRAIDIAGLTAQFSSQFCAILSCFIFSKVTYAVCNECLAMIGKFNNNVDVRIGSEMWNRLRRDYLEGTNIPQQISTAGFNLQPQAASTPDRNITEMFQRLQDNLHNVEHRHRAYLTILQKMDQKYTNMVKASLEPYGTWFAIHWVLYTLTAFMSIAYFAETVTQELYGGICHHEHTVICRLNLAFILLFTLEHCILFLYPCFRAASVTAARGIFIKRVSEASWNYVPHAVKESFIQYLENHRSGFKVSILCTKIDFGYNIAYISIFVGIFGVILKLSF